MKVVLDTNVVVSAFVSPKGSLAQVLNHLRAGSFELVVCGELIQEYREILILPKLHRLHRLTVEQVDQALHDLLRLAIMVQTGQIDTVVRADPDDDILFACALAGNAEIIVSGDAEVQAVKQFRGVHVLAPATFLALLNQLAQG